MCVCLCDRHARCEIRFGTELEFRGELDAQESSQNVSDRKCVQLCDSGGKITSPLGRQRGEDVQPEAGLKSQDRAEQWVSLPQRREGQCSRS